MFHLSSKKQERILLIPISLSQGTKEDILTRI
jgi:hypothetical protein